MIKRLMSYFKNYKIYAILCPILMLLEVLGDVAMPLFMSKIINRVSNAEKFTDADINFIIKMGVLMVLVALAAMFCGAFSSSHLSLPS